QIQTANSESRQVIFFILCFCVCQSGAESLHYSLAEEMERDSFVANIAKDLGVSPSQLAARKARVVSEGNEQLFRLNQNTGALTAKESLDRDEICPQSDTCTLFFKIFFENPFQLIRGEVEVLDVNDNSPVFPEKEMVLEILETASPGSRFHLESAQDKDVGSNGLQNYSLESNSHFSLALETGKDGLRYVELVLQRQLDREEQRELNLLLTATDGGSPPRSGTAQVRIVVVDANDNIPVFRQEVYEVRLPENSPPEQLVVRVAAADPDEGSYGKVRYAFTQTLERSRQLFELNPATGEIRVDAPSGTVVALLHVQDRDSGANGEVRCSIGEGLPFRLEKSFEGYYRVVTARELDREEVAEYNVTVRAADGGSPSLWSGAVLALRVLDVNDNAPVFAEARYSARLPENNAAGALVLTVRAADADWGQNARVRYRLSEGRVRGAPLSSYVSVQAETGALYALRSFDYEEVREVGLWVRAEDGGAPALSSNVSVRLVIVDENDNAPQVLYPPAAPGAGWAGVELAPRSAEPGALVAKVVAVDADAGQNAWLSYELAKATEPGLFRVGLHSGEVRTARAVSERDAARQRLVVLVRDRGQPPRSATATLGIALVDGFSDAHVRVSEEAPAAEPDGPLTLYLIASLACVSSLFLATAVAAVVVKVRRARRSQAEPLPTFPKAATESNAGSLPRNYVYDVCFAAGTVNSEFRFLRPLFPCFPAGLPPGPGEQRSSAEDLPTPSYPLKFSYFIATDDLD
uniref:Cadherin domain-containing protein n=1 Tax=Falco tinnunculus TaxID=100819 RepID=A0A8C4UYI9_FALTI